MWPVSHIAFEVLGQKPTEVPTRFGPRSYFVTLIVTSR